MKGNGLANGMRNGLRGVTLRDVWDAWPFLGALVAVAIAWGSTQSQLRQQAGEIQDIKADVHEILDLRIQVEENARRLRAQARGLNWVGSAVEALAEERGINRALPARPIVNEE